MAVSKGTNSYVTVAEADAYFQYRLDAAAWVNSDVTRKGQALVTATSMLDEMTWAGTVISDPQNLAFPRVCEYFDPKLGALLYLDGYSVPDRIIKATYELAIHLLNNEGLLDSTDSVGSLSAGVITISNIVPAEKIPAMVRRLVKPLLINAGSNAWWRSN